MELTVARAADMRQLGERVGRLLHGGDLIMLNGPLGAGKTTLTQGIARGMGVGARVVSPTFVIAQVHHSAGDGPDLVHVDAYRLNSLEELDALDLDASLEESVTVVEWGEGKVEVLSPDRLMISIARAAGGDPLEVDTPRTVGLEASGPRSQQLLAQLDEAQPDDVQPGEKRPDEAQPGDVRPGEKRPDDQTSRDAVPMGDGGEQAQEAS